MAKKCNSRLKQYGFGDWLGKQIDEDKWWTKITPGINTLDSLREDGKWDNSADNMYVALARNSGAAGSLAHMFLGDKGMKENAGVLGTGFDIAMKFAGVPTFGAGSALGQIAQGQYESEVGLANQAKIMQNQTDAYNTNMTQMNEQNRLNALRQQRLSGMYDNTPQQYGSMMANGGMMKSYSGNTVPSNKAGTYFANGGTHEQNPLGGIPIGNRGSVEEGEYLAKLKGGDYIFSNRF